MKIKDIGLDVDDSYITSINDIAGEVKNITLKVEITDIKKVELEEGIIECLKLKDNSGIISGIIISNRNKELNVVNKTYLVKGNVVILKEPNDKELDFIKDKISSFIKVGDMYIVIKVLKEVN